MCASCLWIMLLIWRDECLKWTLNSIFHFSIFLANGIAYT
jgi:hypothetical protein